MIDIPNQYQKNLYRLALVFFIVLSLYYAVRVLSEFRLYRETNPGFNSITLSGYGEVSAVPDIATVYFTITKEGKTVKEAQDAVALVEKGALDSVEANGVADKDVKTSNVSFSPKYNYGEPCFYETGLVRPCYTAQKIVGYESSESITVKVRNTDDVGKIMQALGTLGVSNLSGPNFAIDDEDSLKAEARKLAIEDAKAKAKVLAKDLGVRLGKVISFGEDGNYPMPMYYSKDMMMSEGAVNQVAPAQVPKGENTISSSVSITYEIK
ncbi:SIMPL domain-containing protein [Candidatus Nomurabacteria bacterium]|nr:SIMPL domain-containing protein [Candidatus Nomurabacteria bacterium]